MILEVGRIPAERNTKYSRMQIKLPVDAVPGENSCEHALLAEFA